MSHEEITDVANRIRIWYLEFRSAGFGRVQSTLFCFGMLVSP